MKYGYEESYTKMFLSKIFSKAGFRRVNTGFYEYDQTIFKKNKYLCKFFHLLMRFNMLGLMPFADIVFITAHK